MNHDQIRDHAYHLWEKAGRPHGRDADFWHQAAEQVAGATEPAPINGHAPDEAAPKPKAASKPRAAAKSPAKAAAAAVHTEAKTAALSPSAKKKKAPTA